MTIRDLAVPDPIKDATAVALGVPRVSLDDPNVKVVTDATVPGAATLWVKESATHGQLGFIAGTTDLKGMYKMILGGGLQMQAAGLKTASAFVDNAVLLRQLQKDFTITTKEAGWTAQTPDEVKAKKPRVAVTWRVSIPVADAVTQLQARIAAL